MEKIKAIIIDFNRTLFNPEKKVLNNGAILILKKLNKRNFTLFLISRGDNNRSKLINELGLIKYFQEVLVVLNKKENDFKNIISRFNIDFQKSFVIGDRVQKEILFGNNCSFQTIWFKNGKFANEVPKLIKEKPNYVIKNLKEVLEIIK